MPHPGEPGSHRFPEPCGPPRQPGAEGTRPIAKAQLDKAREMGREDGRARGTGTGRRPRPSEGQDTQWPRVLRQACGSHVVAPCGPGGFGASERRLGNLRFPF